MDSLMPYVAALVPTIGVGLLFFFVIKYMLEGDRKERQAHARWEAQQRRGETEESDGDGPAGS